MPRIALVTDSAACIPAALKQEFDIHQLAFELVWDGTTHRDGVDLTPADFYHRSCQARTFPTTSQPPLGAFLTVYSELSQQSDGIVSIHVSGDMTGTVRTARLAAERSTRVSIRVLDSRTAMMAEGFVVLAAARGSRRRNIGASSR